MMLGLGNAPTIRSIRSGFANAAALLRTRTLPLKFDRW